MLPGSLQEYSWVASGSAPGAKGQYPNGMGQPLAVRHRLQIWCFLDSMLEEEGEPETDN